ncbi:hypothetical protein CFP65_6376 [Kitasatospora sp. MMS16-BH015]|uniref:hypothetical protein n=1 Tax=Kitasatospora sp. MMS16-BH015 TaxID=2018025 RepID=UPI000CA19454|nr:hypothetical protein [Kitasatospora sp. MMS16-BH015]AUG81032.1 hypothetical protein CFP65_6376 [Kitasatospora sp. MMS16-BH015]
MKKTFAALTASKAARRTAALVAAPVLALTVASGTAFASDPVVSNTSACVATLQHSGSSVRIDPNRNNWTCAFGIWDYSIGGWVAYQTTGNYSAWVYNDGALQMGVYSSATGYWNWGPYNG